MGRLATHTTETLLAAAAHLFAEGGARAVTMVAVARASGAPSGSVYHRFRDRPALLHALWECAVQAFDQAYRDHLGEDPTPQRAAEQAVWTVEWCRRHPDLAAVLNAGRQAFSPETWAAASIDELRAYEEERDRDLTAKIAVVAEAAGRRPDEVAYAMVELPIAVVRRYLPGAIPDAAGDLVRRLASRLLLDS